MRVIVALVAVLLLGLGAGCDDGSTNYESGQDITDALASAGIDVTAPKKVTDKGFVQQVGGESWTTDIGGNSAFINLFPNEETLANWLEMSKGFGGIAVVGDTWAVSLDTDGDARKQSARMAPKVADALGGSVEQ